MNIIKQIFAFLFGFKGSISQKHYAVFLVIYILSSYFYITVSSVLGALAMLARDMGKTQSAIILGGSAIALMVGLR